MTPQEWCVPSSESTEKRIRKLPIGAGIDPLKHGKIIRFAGDVSEILELLNSMSLVGIAVKTSHISTFLHFFDKEDPLDPHGTSIEGIFV